MQIDSLESFLISHIKNGSLSTENSILLDIGAYRGDFTQFMLSESHIQNAFLFEPNLDNYTVLETTFQKNNKIKLINQAVGNTRSTLTFYCNNDLATGSILQYNDTDDQNNPSTKKCSSVEQITIDDYLENTHSSERISFIKIDTQGYDLNVLKGAVNTIQKHQPWLIVELIYIPLYHNQASPASIMTWANEQNYSLAGLFNVHNSADGWLAFADGVFIPTHKTQGFKAPYSMNASITHLNDEIAMLRNACEERLALINRLHNESKLLRTVSEERLELINKLHNNKKTQKLT